MTLVKFKPFAPAQYLFGDLYDELFNNYLNDSKPTQEKKHSHPAVNIIEEKDKYILELAVPGINKEDIEIKLEDEELIISSKAEHKDEGIQENFVRVEYNYDSFKRVFSIPDTVDTKSIDAKYENGILQLILKKKEEAIKKGPISIKVK